MRVYFDTSAFFKRYSKEPGGQEVDVICLRSSKIALSIISVTEVCSILSRLRRENALSQAASNNIKETFLAELADIILCEISPQVIDRSIDLLERHYLRALDALHVACALEWQPDLFVSSDIRQLEAAESAGLVVRKV